MINLGKLSPSLTPHFLNPSHFRCPCIKSKGSLTPHALTPHPNFYPIHRKFHLMLLHLKLPDLVSYEQVLGHNINSQTKQSFLLLLLFMSLLPLTMYLVIMKSPSYPPHPHQSELIRMPPSSKVLSMIASTFY